MWKKSFWIFHLQCFDVKHLVITIVKLGADHILPVFKLHLSNEKIHIQETVHFSFKGAHPQNTIITRGLTKENTQLGIIFPIGYFKFPIVDILFNWGLVIWSLNLRYQTHISPIPNWIYYPQLGIWDPQLGILCPIGDIVG